MVLFVNVFVVKDCVGIVCLDCVVRYEVTCKPFESSYLMTAKTVPVYDC